MAEATDSVATPRKAIHRHQNSRSASRAQPHQARLRAYGYRVSQFSHAELRAFAEAYLADHREGSWPKLRRRRALRQKSLRHTTTGD